MEPDTVNDVLETVGITHTETQGLLYISAIVAATAAVSFIARLVLKRVEARCEKTPNLWDDVFIHALRRPFQTFIWLQGVYWAAEVAYHYSEAELFTFNDVLLRFGFILLIVWAMLGFVRGAERVMISDRMENPMDYTTMTAVSKLARAVIFIVAGLVIIQNLGYSISGVLAFGGVGGIAVGFAARDMLANFFGGAVVYMDQPFKVGDWVRSPDQNIEGVVENIGWRVTRIRTFDLRPLYVPNSVFATISVENPSRMFNRRIFETVGVRYQDVDVVGDIVEAIRTMLQTHEDIDTNQILIVNFTTYNQSSLDIMVYTFTKTRQWVEFHRVKQDVLLRISQIIGEHGAEIAFPTRTLHLAGEQDISEELAGLTPQRDHEGRGSEGSRGSKHGHQLDTDQFHDPNPEGRDDSGGGRQ